MRKNLFVLILLLSLGLSSQAQKFRGLDKSPMDMAYYPDNFAHDIKFAPEKVGKEAFVRVTYSRPAKKDREVFGGKLVPYDKVWRFGANEATEIKFFKEVKIDGKKVKAGVYSLFAIPTADEWTIILNSETDIWGDYDYKEVKDVMRFKVKTKSLTETLENLSIVFTKSETKGADMHIGWDKTGVTIPIEF
jgi:hypothetical protein